MKYSVMVLFAMAIGFSPFAATPQEKDESTEGKVKIEILNQDGEPVRGKLISPKGTQQSRATGSLRVEKNNGKIIITDENGKSRTLDVDGARSVIVTQSAQSTNVDGKQETKKSGRAIIVGADGTRHEIEIGDGPVNLNGLTGMNLIMPNGNGVFQFNQSENKYMIGVSCEPVGAAMTSQLRLASGTGLLVVNVDPESPAGKAGIELHDILLYGDQEELTNLQTLIEAVQKAGKDSKSLSFTLLRGGKEKSIDVKPTERPAGQFGMTIPNGGLFPNFNRNLNMQFRDLGPGVIIGGTDDDVDLDMKVDVQAIQDRMNMKQQMDAVRAQMEAMQKRMDQHFNRSDR